MSYKPVYAPDGQFFEVPQHIFEKVILEGGWTQTKPEPAPAAEPKEEKPARRSTSKAKAVKEVEVEIETNDEVDEESPE